MKPHFRRPTLFLGQRHEHLPRVDSTNEYLRQKLQQHSLPEGFVVSTAEQTSGRGQMGTRWQSAPARNLLFSFVLYPQHLLAAEAFRLNMSICLGICEALEQFYPGLWLKWPNDILLHGKKMGGLLLENSLSGGQVRQTVVGVGLNINQIDWADVALPQATSLRAVAGHSFALEPLLGEVLHGIEAHYLRLHSDGDALRTDYLQRLHGYFSPVPVIGPGGVTQMQVKDVYRDGHLLAEVDGRLNRFGFKEIRFVL